jgi:hypothetical protein
MTRISDRDTYPNTRIYVMRIYVDISYPRRPFKMPCPLCQSSHSRPSTGSSTTATRMPILPRSDPIAPLAPSEDTIAPRNCTNTLPHTAPLSHPDITLSVTILTLNHTSMFAPLNPAAIGTNTVETYGNTHILWSASTYITSPHGISPSLPQKLHYTPPHVRGVAPHNQAQLQTSEGPRLPGTIHFWPPSRRPTRSSKRRVAETLCPLGHLVHAYQSTSPMPQHEPYLNRGPEGRKQHQHMPLCKKTHPPDVTRFPAA